MLFRSTPTSDKSIDPTADYSTLIIGAWQLTEVGTPSNGNAGGCGSSSGETLYYSWESAPEIETLSFKTGGVFLQETKNDAGCKGTYQINSSNLAIKSDCAQVAPNQPIALLTMTMLIVEKTDGNHLLQYKYQRK